MGSGKLRTRTRARCASLAPFIGLAGTLYGIHNAFQHLDAAEGARGMVFNGILAALAATVTLMVLVYPAARLYEFLRGSDDDDDAA